MLETSHRRLGSFIVGLLVTLFAPLAHAGNQAHITTQPSNRTVGVSGTANFSVTATGDPTLLYQWSFNGSSIAGATSSVLTLANVQSTNQGSYQVVVTNDFGSDTSSVVTLTVKLKPSVTGSTHTGTVTAGATASFTIFTTGQPPLFYQWAFDGTNLAGATSSTLSIPNAQSTNSGTYQVVVTNTYGSANGPQLTLAVTLPPVVTGSSSSGPTPVGGTASFNVFLSGATPFSYQWYFESSSSTNALAEATNSALSITNVQTTNEGSYQLFVTNAYGWTQSPALALSVLAGLGPMIGGQPVSQTVPESFSASFQVFVSGSTPLSYQWSFDGADIASATNSALAFIAVQDTNAGSYQVVVTNLFGAQTSAVATLTVPLLALQAPGVVMAPLLSFDAGTNGSQPDSAVIYGSDGNLYVTASEGGANDVNLGGDGTVSKMDTNGNVLWTVSLSQASGANPAAGLVQGAGGVLYGTTVNGGGGFGTVFKITSGGSLTPLYSFTNGVDGANPEASLELGSDGYLYGTTSKGGANDVGSGGDGTIFKMTTNGVLVWSVSFNKTNGRRPVSGLVQGSDGTLYGTTPSGGANDLGIGGGGTVFAITTNGVLTSLYSFAGDANGAIPEAGLALGPDGSLYGTTTAGGNLSLNSGLGFGTVFNITTAGALSTLAAFNGTNGVSPRGALALGVDFNFYGATARGGVDYPVGYGTLFQVTMSGALTSLLSFNGNYGGAYPEAGLTQAAPGVFYGTTAQGGTNDLGNGGDGSVFRFSLPPAPAPTVGGISPVVGPTNGGTVVSIAGSGFEIGATVTFGSLPAVSVSANSPTNITAVTPPSPEGIVNVAITNVDGNAVTFSNSFTFGIPPSIQTSPSGQSVAEGGSAQFQVGASSESTASYQWLFNGANLPNNIRLTGLGTATLTINNVATSDEGSYQVVVTNPYGVVTSAVATLTVTPLITQQPQSLTIPQTFIASFQVIASSSAPLSYQWWFDRNDIPSATNQTLSLANLQAANAGSYQVVVTSAFGAVTSAVATLTVPVLALQAPGVVMAPLLSFDAGTNGSQPDSAVIYGSDGNLYVTASEGGANDVNLGGDGTVSKMDTNGNVLWTVSLSQASGANPAAGLVQGAGGVLYGTTVNGGGGFGTVFKITSGGSLTPLYSFTNGVDGANPEASLELGSDGYLYGTTSKGGANDVGSGGDGTIFKMTTNGVLVWSVSFNKTNGRRPVSGLVQGSDGTLYGTTPSGGANDLGIGGGGTVFAITTNGVLTSLYSFAGDANGAVPTAGLALGPDGSLYSTTTEGGNTTLNSGLGFGTIFDITTNGVITTLATFDGTNGFSPRGALALGSDDNFYGATAQGGVAYPLGYGTIFRVTMNGGLTNLLSFNGSVDGAYPNGGLTEVNPGVFYGTTQQGGSNHLAGGGDGTVFRFTSPAGPPGIANVLPMLVPVEVEITITNSAFSPNGPLTFTLDASDPAGAYITTNGIFQWDPACEQGSTTNLITIWATDSGNPPQSNSMSFTVTVGDCVRVSVGASAVQIGMNTCVPVNLLSTVSLTNLNFSIFTLANRFTNWAASASNPALASAAVQAADAARPQFNFAVQNGQTLLGASFLGYICVDVLPIHDSAFAPLLVTNIVATEADSTLAESVFGKKGKLVLIEGSPLLRAWRGTNSTPMLTLFGNPGITYLLISTTNLSPPITWTPFISVTMTDLFQYIYPGPATNQLQIFRAVVQP